MNHIAISVTLVLLAAAIPTVRAQGLLDFADPCVKGKQQFKSTADALRSQGDFLVAKYDTMEDPPADVAPLYKDALKEAMFKSWMDNPQTGPLVQLLTHSQPDFDPKKFFLASVYPNAITAAQEKDLIRGVWKSDYATSVRPKLVENREELDRQIDSQKSELDGSCKNGEFDKMFRMTVGNFAGIVASNFTASKNERGEMAKAVRATSGISLTDIQKYGITGGPNSAINKALGDASRSDLVKLINGLTAALDPGSWKVPVPKIDVPKLPNVPLPQLPKAPEIRIPTPRIEVPKLPSCCHL